jgi:Protein of unknown function (DUF3000)
MSRAGGAAPRRGAAAQRAAAAAEVFRSAAEDLEAERERQQDLRPELSFDDVPAPKRLAPYAAAFAVAVAAEDGAQIATGRLIMLYDPAGQPGWAGPLRIVAQIQADIDSEIAADPLLGRVGWSWLTEALDARAAHYAAPSGTVTRVVTEGFGAKRDDPAATEFELRASWSPVDPAGHGSSHPPLAGHLAAWCDALCAASGLPPVAPGVSALPPPRARARRGRRGHEGQRSGDLG